MTRDDIIRIAQEAGFNWAWISEGQQRLECFYRAAYAAGAAAEREACAEIAEKQLRNTAMLTCNPPKSAAAWDIRNAIRARGTP